MIEAQDLIRKIACHLDEASLDPVLIGGAALIHHGSDRVTKDFDIVIRASADPGELMDIIYGAGFRLITRFHDDRSPRRFIEESGIAALKCKEEKPDALFFYHPKRDVRLDVLLDFPAPAAELRRRAVISDDADNPISVASRPDLRWMKEKAYRDRGASRDAMDLLFLGMTEEELAEIRIQIKK
ncbi:MAG: nucleotidyl transferase AbiEii/AbiGii toxin family protein [Candidatus Hydrogenedentota bacterium]